MAHRLTDAQVDGIRAGAAAGRSSPDLAAEFGVTRRHVDRLVRGDQRVRLGGPAVDVPSVVSAVRELLGDLELDLAGRVLGAGALVLAAKLDTLAASDAAAAAAAAPGLVRQLSESLRELRGVEDDLADTVRRMLEPLVKA